MNKKARKVFKRLVNTGFIVSAWFDARCKKYICVISRPKWSGSCTANGPTFSKALLACAKLADEQETQRCLVKATPKAAPKVSA